jgi:hypothetical protein
VLSHDADGRLEGASSPALGVLGYEFDAAGNLSVVRDFVLDPVEGYPIEVRTFDWSNRMVRKERNDTGTTTDYGHDGRGNLATAGARTYYHDVLGRLRNVTRDGTMPIEELTYDPMDRLVLDVQSSTGQWRRLSHFGTMQVGVGDETDSRSLVPDIAGFGWPLEMVGGGKQSVPTWLFGTATQTRDESGAMLSQQVLAPYGERLLGDDGGMPCSRSTAVVGSAESSIRVASQFGVVRSHAG